MKHINIIMHIWDIDIADHTLKHHTRGSSEAIHILELHAATTNGRPPTERHSKVQ